MSYYSKICNELDNAATDGIITEEQKYALQKRFDSRRGFLAKITLSQWLAAAGGIFIVLGIILIVAFNWDNLGSLIKIAAFLLIYAAAGLCFIKASAAGKPLLKNIPGMIWFFLPAAGIGLYAQIFQLSGSPLKPYLTWAVLSAPLAIFIEGKAYSRLLSALLFYILFKGSFSDNSAILLVFPEPGTSALVQAGHWAGALALLAAALGINFYKKDLWSAAPAAALVWLSILMFPEHSALFAGSAELGTAAIVSCSLLFIFYKKKFCTDRHDIIHGIINSGFRIWIINLYILSFCHKTSRSSLYYAHNEANTAIGQLLAALLAGLSGWLISRTKFFPENPKADSCIKTIFTASILSPLLPLIFGSPSWTSCAVLANILLLAAGICLLWQGSEYGSKKALNNGMFLIILIAVTRFIDLFSSQLTTGIAFILSGIFFAFMAWWFSRGVKKLAAHGNIKTAAAQLTVPEYATEIKSNNIPEAAAKQKENAPSASAAGKEEPEKESGAEAAGDNQDGGEVK